MLSRGVDVIDIGLASTDELWFASGWLDLPGAMFTASHNPAATTTASNSAWPAPSRSPQPTLPTSPNARAGQQPLRAAARRGKRTEQDLLTAYADHLHSLVDLTGIRRLTVVVDAGNGMAGHTLPAVLGP